MSQFIESIRLENGNFLNLNLHQERVDTSIERVFGRNLKVNLKEEINDYEVPAKGIYKCRIIYDSKVHSVEFTPYTITPIKKLKIVHDNSIEYSLKFADRSSLNKLFKKKESCDDVLIVKNGEVTDCSYSNIVFFTGTSWVTPKSALLKGVMRTFLLSKGIIREERISVEQINDFKKAKLINALLGFDGPEIGVSDIVF